jgi:predicted Zn finger-like uncharacterized protein
MILNCPHCENEFYIRDELAGQTVSCHRCKKPVEAPAKTFAPIEQTQNVPSTQQESLPVAPDAEPGIKAQAGAVEKKGGTITLRRGLRRLALFLSILLGPVLFLVVSIRAGFNFDDYLIRINVIFSFLDRLKPNLRIIVEFGLLWVIGFLSVWAVYGLVSFLVGGFFKADAKKKEM